MSATLVMPPHGSTSSPTTWTHFSTGSSRSVGFVPYRDIWIQADTDVARTIFMKEFGFDPCEPFCPCPLHSTDGAAGGIYELARHEDADLAMSTLAVRNGILRRGREHPRPINPNNHRNPIVRREVASRHPYQRLPDYIFATPNARFIFTNEESYRSGGAPR